MPYQELFFRLIKDDQPWDKSTNLINVTIIYIWKIFIKY